MPSRALSEAARQRGSARSLDGASLSTVEPSLARVVRRGSPSRRRHIALCCQTQMEQEAPAAQGRKVKGRGAKSAADDAARYAGDAGVFESIDGGSGPGPQRCEPRPFPGTRPL